MEDAAEIISALSKFAWPALAAIVLWRAAPYLPDFMSELRKAIRSRGFTVKVGSAELTVEEATKQTRTMLSDLQEKVTQLASPAVIPAKVPVQGAAAAAAGIAPRSRFPMHVLWVDDHPENNAFITTNLRDEGVQVTEVGSTGEALDHLSRDPTIGAVVTDIGRREGRDAGVKLVEAARAQYPQLPLLVYSSRKSVGQYIEDLSHLGVAVATSSPVTLLASLQRAAGDPEL